MLNICLLFVYQLFACYLFIVWMLRQFDSRNCGHLRFSEVAALVSRLCVNLQLPPVDGEVTCLLLRLAKPPVPRFCCCGSCAAVRGACAIGWCRRVCYCCCCYCYWCWSCCCCLSTGFDSMVVAAASVCPSASAVAVSASPLPPSVVCLEDTLLLR